MQFLNLSRLLQSAIVSLIFIWATSIDAATYQSHRLLNQQLQIISDQYQVQLKALTNGAIEVNYLGHGEQEFPSFALDENFSSRLNIEPVKESEYSLTYEVDNLKAVISKKDLRIRFYRDNTLLVAEETGYFNTNTVRGFRFDLSNDEKLMGTGERVLGMNRRGHRLPLYNRAHYGYTTESTQMNFSIPAVMSDKKYILLFDNGAKAGLI